MFAKLFLFSLPVAILFAQPARADSQAAVLSCRIFEATSGTQVNPPIEDLTLNQALKPLSAGSFSPGGQATELKYTTKDGLFQIDVEAIKPLPNQAPQNGHVIRDYLPIWITNVKTGQRIAASGNGGGSSPDLPNNDYTNLSGEFPESIQVECFLN